MGNTLSKAERLSGKKSVSSLLAGGRWGSYGHFRYCWRVQENPFSAQEACSPSLQNNAHQDCMPPAPDSLAPGLVIPLQTPGRVLISVPKRFFKRAVKRNLLKRRIREAYRVQKLPGVDVFFQYNSQELADFAAVQADVTAILSRISSSLAHHVAVESTAASVAPADGNTPENMPEA